MRTRRLDNVVESLCAVRGQVPSRVDIRIELAPGHDRRERGLFCVLRCGDVGDRKLCCDEGTGPMRRRLRCVARCDSAMLPNHQRESVVLGLATTQAAVGVDSDDGVGTTGKAGAMRVFSSVDRLRGTGVDILRRTAAREVIGSKGIIEQCPTHIEFRELREFRERGIK